MWTRKPPPKYDSLDLENLEDTGRHTALSNPRVQRRSVFEEAAPSRKPEFMEQGKLPQDLPEAVIRGEDVSRLVAERPDDIIPILRDHAVTKLGEFHTNDPELLKAFEKKKMVTYAFDEVYILDYDTEWSSILRHEGRKHLSDDGWHDTMTIAVYCVHIRSAADVLEKGMLWPLLIKAKTGDEDDTVWDFPSVRAVIDFKWMHWARKYLIAEFLLYLGWLLCFVGFMIIYIEKNLEKGFLHDMDGADKTFALFAYTLDAGSMLFMCPFLVIKYNSIRYYKWQWLSMWNMIDSLSYILQFLVSFSHFTTLGLDSNFYVNVLVLHCTLLFIKVQYFARVMNPKAAYVEILKTVTYNVRYFLLFIVLSMTSAALCLAAFYKREIRQKGDDEDFMERVHDFSSLPRTIVVAFSIFLGNFESDYIFGTENRFMKGAFFFLFQLFMSITVFNLFIAVMVESYATTMKKENIMYYRCKAQIVGELELSLPKMLHPRFKSYVHFVVCEKRIRLPYELSCLVSGKTTNTFEEEIRNELMEFKKIMAEKHEDLIDKFQTINESFLQLLSRMEVNSPV